MSRRCLGRGQASTVQDSPSDRQLPVSPNMPGQPGIGQHLFRLYLALVLLEAGGLEADQLVWWRVGSIPGTQQASPPHLPQRPPGSAADPQRLRRPANSDSQSAANEKVQMFKFSTWTGQTPNARLPGFRTLQKRDLRNSSGLLTEPLPPHSVNNAQTKVTATTDNLNQLLDQSVNYNMCLYHQDGREGCSARAEPFARQICDVTPKASRVSRLLFHPAYPSRCWRREDHQECPPPVLTNATLGGLLSDEPDECVLTAVHVLCEIVQVNAQIERAELVMASGFCTGATSADNSLYSGAKNASSGDNQDCDEGDSSTYTRCKNCQECKVSRLQSILTFLRRDPVIKFSLNNLFSL